jgi:hypothetical protein
VQCVVHCLPLYCVVLPVLCEGILLQERRSLHRNIVKCARHTALCSLLCCVEMPHSQCRELTNAACAVLRHRTPNVVSCAQHTSVVLCRRRRTHPHTGADYIRGRLQKQAADVLRKQIRLFSAEPLFSVLGFSAFFFYFVILLFRMFCVLCYLLWCSASFLCLYLGQLLRCFCVVFSSILIEYPFLMPVMLVILRDLFEMVFVFYCFLVGFFSSHIDTHTCIRTHTHTHTSPLARETQTHTHAHTHTHLTTHDSHIAT